MAADATDYSFDDLDMRIVDMLKENGRATNRDIAKALNVTRTTVATRIARMTESGGLRIVAAADFASYGYDVLLAIAVSVEGREPEDVAEDLARLPEVFAVHLVTGPRPLEILLAAHDVHELSGGVIEGISNIDGIRDIDVGVVTDITKYQFDVGISR
ncbi:hypothetical protein MB02_08960 [Croceicoccus estronivorus]|uniref:Lrp/AsnC family transcriptional regulator n=1 Tax=Croceicoccus estronivorus TaxID=1172626 RepID=UPI00082A4AB1|nr:Lrp/AsnC family transcriptional regulator [Croceicoccus estronivorus]OCC23936.1 hypothetical protein MB02_08960 [Croceicoccus estronivorus]